MKTREENISEIMRMKPEYGLHELEALREEELALLKVKLRYQYEKKFNNSFHWSVNPRREKRKTGRKKS
jgi:hypothetical protein